MALRIFFARSLSSAVRGIPGSPAASAASALPCRAAARYARPIVGDAALAADKVFISYAHSPEHSPLVLAFANALRAQGVDADIDRYHVRPKEGWPRWCEKQLRPDVSRYVIAVCTQIYRQRADDDVKPDEGRGVYWEVGLIYQYQYDDKGDPRLIPVLLGDEPQTSIPDAFRGQTIYRIKAFDLSDPGYQGLYRELTAQLAVTMPPLRPQVKLDGAPATALPRREALSNFPAIDISRIDRYAPEELIGRETETAVIDEAWRRAVAGEKHPRVLTFVALGGEGKTALVAKWAMRLIAGERPSFEAAFAWSFYSQGTREQVGASSDLFLAEALKFFGGEERPGESGHDKGKRLADIVGKSRALLILDGVEPLQYEEKSPLKFELKDLGLLALLKGLAQRNAGLCLVTTRYKIANMLAWTETAPQLDLAPLSKQAGAKLLERFGVNGTAKEREQLAEDLEGHALTLEILGGYLRDAHGGDIRKRDLVKLEEADAEEKGGHAFRALDAYVRWFEGGGEQGKRALAMWQLMGLFDRPADAGSLEALWREPAIAGLTEPLVSSSDAQRNLTLKRLEDAKLVSVARDAGGALVRVDAHPLLREYFAKRLRETMAESWKAAHKRLYEHLTTTEDKETPTLDDLQPLYEAVAHGCAAGLYEEARAEVFIERILRGAVSDGFYSTFKLGAYGADLGAVACFFDPPWRRVSSHLAPEAQAWLLNETAFRLRALGRLAEAREPMRAGLEMRIAQEDWKNAAASANNLSELELTLGEVDAATHDAEAALAHADRGGLADQRMRRRATHANALQQAGRRAEAAALLAEAEAMQAESHPHEPWLYSLRGFHYCDLLLGEAERAAWRRRCASVFPGAAAAKPAAAAHGAGGDDPPDLEALLAACSAVTERASEAIKVAEHNRWLLEIGLDRLTLARAALYAATLRGGPPLAEHVDAAVDFLRRAGAQHHLPHGLLTRALWRGVRGDFAAAREDLDEAWEIAERGPMQLHLADIHLHRARLFGLFPGRPESYPWSSAAADLAEARKLIDACGYGRRRDELADAEAALAAPPPGASVTRP